MEFRFDVVVLFVIGFIFVCYCFSKVIFSHLIQTNRWAEFVNRP